MKNVLLAACLIWGFITIGQAAQTVKKCEKSMPESLKSKLCEIRQYKLFDGPDMEKHIDCVMKAVGFVNGEGRGDYHKLYKPLNAIEKHRKHDFNLEKCAGQSFKKPQPQRAYAFYKCLLESDSAESFKKVFDLVELIVAGKLPVDAKYSPTVAEMMKKRDAKVCKPKA